MKSISQVAKLTGVSIRTLQYYNEIGLLKRGRLDRLIQLLERLEKGEQCMSFKEFDLSDYINALEDFKSNQAETVIQHWEALKILICSSRRSEMMKNMWQNSPSSSLAVLKNILKK